MTERVDRDTLLARLLPLAAGPRRRLVAIAGPPGAGKSHTAEDLRSRIEAVRPGRAAVLAMDGFHYDDLVLGPSGLLPRKGAPETFDTEGLRTMLDRLAADGDRPVAVPIFDRSIEIARAGAGLIAPEIRLILVEGNYLLLDEPDWTPIRMRFDLTVLLDLKEDILRKRLIARWANLPPEEAEKKVAGNDLLNARTVRSRSCPADFVMAGT